MNLSDYAGIVIAIIAAAGAWAAQRAAARASTSNTSTTSRVDMEKEAYDRARSYDTETIRRQDSEIEELREENKELRAEVLILRDENRELQVEVGALKSESAARRNEVSTLQRRILRLEKLLPPDTSELEHTHGNYSE